MKKLSEYKGYDSNEEIYFHWWMEELLNKGIIKEFRRADEIVLADKIEGKWLKEYKTKEDEWREEFYDYGVNYTPDFHITWKQIGEFAELENSERKVKKKIVAQSFFKSEPFSIVEIKGDYDFRDKTREVQLKRKWTYQKTGIYVNLVKIPKLFKDTFTPKRYLFTDEMNGSRKIKFTIKTLDEWIRQ